MNRNKDAGFNQVPRLDITRSRFKRRQDVKLTLNAGQLIPFYVDEVLPGDTFSIDQAAIIRMTTPIFPVMDNCHMDIYYFKMRQVFKSFPVASPFPAVFCEDF